MLRGELRQGTQLMLDVFRLLGDDHPLTARDRRDLTRALFCFEVTCLGCDPLGDEGISLRANLPRRLHPLRAAARHQHCC
jgi:hypothetical protein